ILTSCQERSDDQSMVLKGYFPGTNQEVFYVSDLVGSPEARDTISVKNGEFTYKITTPVPDIRIISNADNTMAFTVTTEPGSYRVDWQNNDYTITGDLNNRVKELHSASRQ